MKEEKELVSSVVIELTVSKTEKVNGGDYVRAEVKSQVVANQYYQAKQDTIEKLKDLIKDLKGDEEELGQDMHILPEEYANISRKTEDRRSQNHTGDHSASQISDAQQKFIKDLMRKGGQRAAGIALKMTKPLEALTSDEASELIEKLKGGESKTK